MSNNRIAFNTSDNEIQIWDLNTQKCQFTIPRLELIRDIKLLPNGNLLIRDFYGTVISWNLETMKSQFTLSLSKDKIILLTPLSNNKIVYVDKMNIGILS